MSFARPNTTRERIFSHNFIQYQYALAIEASRFVISEGLLEEDKINTICYFMYSLYVTTGDVKSALLAGGENASYTKLNGMIYNTMHAFNKAYHGHGKHPLSATLQRIANNVTSYMQASQLQDIVSYDEGCTDDSLDVDASYPHMDAVPELVFSQNFIQHQYSIFARAGQFFDSKKVCEENKIKSIIDYMRDLEVNSATYAIAGKQEKDRSYEGLLTLIDDITTQLQAVYRLGGKSPFVTGLDTIKKNLQEYIRITQPQFWASLRGNQARNTSTVADARFEIAKDTCGILSCLAWSLVQKPVTLCNGAGFCPEIQLPSTTHSGKRSYWDVCAPWNSVKALTADIEEQRIKLDELQKAPIRHSMK